MYKTLLTAGIALLSITTAHAQTRIVAESKYLYDNYSSSDQLVDTSTYNYSNGRGGAAGEIIHYDTSIYYIRNGSSGIKPQYRFEQVYNTQGLPVMYKWSYWDETSQSTPFWRNTMKRLTTYNIAGRLLIDSSIQYTMTDSLPFAATENVFNSGGQLIDSMIFQYTTAMQTWDTAQRYIYTYDNSGRKVMDSFSINNLGSMTPKMRHSYSYPGASTLCSVMTEEYLVGSNWRKTLEVNYFYNTNNQVSEEYQITNRYPSIVLDTVTRFTYTYGANNKISEKLEDTLNQATRVWTKYRRYLYTYNSDENCTSYIEENWDEAMQMYRTMGLSYKHYYYYESYTPAAVAQLKQQGGKLTLYPVPAINTLNIDVQWDKAQSYSYIVADMQGRIVLQSHEQLAQQAIDISHLPAGAYNLILKGDKGGLQHSKFTLVK